MSAATPDENVRSLVVVAARAAGVLQENGDLAVGAGKCASAQAVLHVLRSDCQQISAHPGYWTLTIAIPAA
jgi:hypothetical protein